MTYILTSTACLTTFYLFYLAFLRTDKLMQLQRAFLLTAIAASLIIPVIDLDWSESSQNLQPVWQSLTIDSNQATPVNTIESEQSLSLQDYLLILYLIGAGLMLIRVAFTFINLLKTIRSSDLEQRDGYTLVTTDQSIPISSFFKFIFISKQEEFTDEELKSILTHERKHITDWHSADVLIMEMVKIVFWFNPAVYMMDKSLRALHEYISDAEAASYGEVSKYEKLLINTFFKKANIPLISQFSEVSIKQRIHMLNQKQPTIMKKFKFLMIIPIATFLIWACDPSEELNEVDNTVSKSDQTPSNAVDMEEGKMITVSGKVTRPDGSTLPGVTLVVKGTQIGTVSDIQGNYKIEIPEGSQLTASFIGFNSETENVNEKSVIDFVLSKDEDYKPAELEASSSLSVNSNVTTENGIRYLTGQVFGKDNKPVSAKIVALGQKGSVETDDQGKFKIKLEDDNYAGKAMVFANGYELSKFEF